MNKIWLSKTEKKVLLLLLNHGVEALDTIPRTHVRMALHSLEQMSFVWVAWIEGGEYIDVILTRNGKDYLIENPKLRNPIDWRWVISIAIAVATLGVSIIALLTACQALETR